MCVCDACCCLSGCCVGRRSQFLRLNSSENRTQNAIDQSSVSPAPPKFPAPIFPFPPPPKLFVQNLLLKTLSVFPSKRLASPRAAAFAPASAAPASAAAAAAPGKHGGLAAELRHLLVDRGHHLWRRVPGAVGRPDVVEDVIL